MSVMPQFRYRAFQRMGIAYSTLGISGASIGGLFHYLHHVLNENSNYPRFAGAQPNMDNSSDRTDR
jgi:hypothetical protein